MLSRTKAQLRAIEDKIAEVAGEAKAVIEAAAQEGRSRTDDENARIAEYHKTLATLTGNKRELEDQYETEKSIEDAVKNASREPEDGNGGGGLEMRGGFSSVQVVAKSVGEQFVESAGYKAILDEIKDKGTGGRFSTGPVAVDIKGTLLEGSGAPGSGSGGGLLQVPQVVPGVVEKLFQRLTVADLLASGVTNTNTLRYVVEGTATSGAAGVAEAAAKPESTLGLSTTDEPVKKVATSLTTSDEMIEDASAVQSYINGRLSLFIKIEEERQILLGGGTNELVGITGRSGVNTWARGTVDTNAVALFKALNGTRGSALLEPDAIIMNPANWQTTRLAVDSAGQFFGGGPFQGPYGAGSNLPASAQVTGAPLDSIWMKPVIVTSAIGSGTALLGSFQMAAQLYRRGGVTVEATNSHSDYFTKNLVAIRAEERLALCVYRPAAFTLVTGLN